ncbi:UNVERIFIED_CONTAM: hypothetical protein PYX00_009488 [Menopon gallinae]|uniref:Mitochondrial import receptor subunit TOM70 n=1 Tax=Menopon gallinae TaxID=328185 RepID=A0AAW2HB61_9NEOP
MAECFGSVNHTMRWQIALAVGVPVVVGFGYWYLNKKNKPSSNIIDEHSAKTSELSLDSDTSNKVSQKRQQKTPLEEATAVKEKGNTFFSSGKYEEAITHYEKAIELCPQNEVMSLATFFQNKAAAYEKLKNYDEVKKACNAALALNPKYTKALLRRAKAYEQTKELALAFEDFTAVCILENFQSQSTLLAADTLLNELARKNAKEALAKRVPTIPSSYFITTYFSTFINDPVHAFSNKIEGDHSKGFLKAVDLMKKKDYDNVIAACTEEINMTEAESLYKNEALVLRGTFHQLCGNYPAAMADLDIVINNEKTDVKLRVNAIIKRACIHIQLEDPTKCFEDFEKAIKIDPDNADIYHHRGQINLMIDKPEEAAKDITLAADLNPNYSVTAVQKCYTDYRCAMLVRDENKLKSVMQRFEQLITDYPQCAECYSLYAQVLSSQCEYVKSDKLYQKALKVDPNNATLLLFRAILKLKWTGDIEAAVGLIKEALEIDDKCSFGYEQLGTIEVQRGNLKKGIELFDKAINLARTELEMTHYFTLKNAAEAQQTVLEKMNITLPFNNI